MLRTISSGVPVKKIKIESVYLEREVQVDLYLPPVDADPSRVSLLLINDGQDLPKFHFDALLGGLYKAGEISHLLCVAIHCGTERKQEYGTVAYKDFKGRGAKAGLHKKFVFSELLPLIREKWEYKFSDIGYAGFSLGGLTAIDIAWHYPEIFSRAGVFSGSLWWRLKDLHDGYDEKTDRIIHKLIREGEYKHGLKFYFTTGSLDETMDRNNNGIIDSIDDTLALIEELKEKGYEVPGDINYINYEDGRHDVSTWGKAMPAFLKWGWGKKV